MLESDQYDTSLGSAKRRMKWPELYARIHRASLTWLDANREHEGLVYVIACLPSRILLLAGAPPSIELDHVFRGSAHVGDDETDSGEKLTCATLRWFEKMKSGS